MIDKRFQTTEGLVEIAREAGFVCTRDSQNGWYVIQGSDADLRRFYMKTAGQILLQHMAEESQRLGLYYDKV